uniref:Carboxypeptidase inhibitor n=1 Tax=Rhipicephalus zambeziensis TaxID=60191 RepID=A0A224YCY9_9ACAR
MNPRVRTMLPRICALAIFSSIMFSEVRETSGEGYEEFFYETDYPTEAPPGEISIEPTSNHSAARNHSATSEHSGIWGFLLDLSWLCHLAQRQCVPKDVCPEHRKSSIFSCGGGYVCCRFGSRCERKGGYCASKCRGNFFNEYWKCSDREMKCCVDAHKTNLTSAQYMSALSQLAE